MDRRAAFFFGTAILCAVMIVPTPDDFRWVAGALSGTYVLLGVAALLDAWSMRRSVQRRRRA